MDIKESELEDLSFPNLTGLINKDLKRASDCILILAEEFKENKIELEALQKNFERIEFRNNSIPSANKLIAKHIVINFLCIQ